MYQECACWLLLLIYELRDNVCVLRVRLLVNITDI